MDSKCLLIIGNGLDLNAGLKTTFSDFLSWLNLNKDFPLVPISPISEKMIVDPDFKNSNKSSFEKFYFDEKQNDFPNFWYLFLYLMYLEDKYDEVPSELDWHNIEAIINYAITAINNNSKFLKRIYFYAKMDEIEDYEKLFNSVKTYSTDCSYTFICLIYCIYLFYRNKQSNFSSKNINSWLMNQLNVFEDKFKEYLNYLSTESHSPLFPSKKEMLLSMTNEYKKANIFSLNFNYTALSSTIIDEQNINYIHGFMGNYDHLIFGIDSKDIYSSDSLYSFTKTFRIMNESIKKNVSTSHILNKQIDKLKFFGHSLSEYDYSYFQSIFDYLSIYDNDVQIEFYYSEFQRNNEVEMLKLEHAVNNLLEKYGETLDNKDHGKNLITKLLLENRLQLKYLDV